jgi:glycosyltransferase involved in cell wall biosynthesis
MKKNILILGIYPPPFGGISTIIHNLVPFLNRNDYHVNVFAPGYVGETVSTSLLKVYKPTKNQLYKHQYVLLFTVMKVLKILFRNSIYRINLKSILTISSWVHYLEEHILKNQKVDCICAFHLFERGLTATLLSSILKIPVSIVSFGEIYTDMAFYSKNINMVKYITEHSDSLISVSEHCAKGYSKLNLAPKVKIIYSAVNPEKFNFSLSDKKRFRIKYGIEPDNYVVLFLGRMIEDMGLDHLLNVIPDVLQEDNNKIHFLIAGAEGHLTESVVKMARQHENNMSCFINLSFDELPRFYTMSDLVIVPTRDDRACMGLTIKEAMFSKRAVIGNNVGGIPEAILHNETGTIIDTSDQKLLGRHIMEFSNNIEITKKMGKNGFDRANRLFSTDISNNQYLTVFNSIS